MLGISSKNKAEKYPYGWSTCRSNSELKQSMNWKGRWKVETYP